MNDNYYGQGGRGHSRGNSYDRDRYDGRGGYDNRYPQEPTMESIYRPEDNKGMQAMLDERLNKYQKSIIDTLQGMEDQRRNVYEKN